MPPVLKTYTAADGGHLVMRCFECDAEIADDCYHLAGCSLANGRVAPVEALPITEEVPVAAPAPEPVPDPVVDEPVPARRARRTASEGVS